MAVRAIPRSASVLRYSEWDAVLVGLAAVHALAIVLVPSVPLIAVGLWWNANTISHNFIHRPFFRSAAANRAFSIGLSLLLGFPQSLWRERHLRHHAETARPSDRAARARRPFGAIVIAETALVLLLWTAIAIVRPQLFVQTYLPGWLIGLVLCQLQGHFEHARGTTSHYGWFYNALLFNDGYHVEHHEWPGLHWSELRRTAGTPGRVSRWPPLLRWLEWIDLVSLERLVLRSTMLQRFVLKRHERAFARALTDTREVRSVTVVGGGLFPRTALVLRRLLPEATLTIVDASAEHLDIARRLLGDHLDHVTLVHGVHGPRSAVDTDLLVIPLGYRGDRQMLYRRPQAPLVVVHDWLWSKHGTSAVVSWLLLKRLNLVVRT
jgi:hypothetical protein